MLYMEKQLWEVLENKKDNYPLKIQIMDTMDNKTHWKDISIDIAKQIIELIDAKANGRFIVLIDARDIEIDC
jgi:RNAse (barnase) inhibitor barstar